MSGLKDFFYQEVEPYWRIGLGHLVGGLAMLTLLGLLYFTVLAVKRIPESNVADLLAMFMPLLIVLLILVGLFRYAYGLITGKR